MYYLFEKLLNMSITAGYLVLVVAFLRLVFHKLPKKYMCCLWALVGFRLIFPWSISSVFSLFNYVPAPTTIEGDLYIAQYTGTPEKPLMEFDIPNMTTPAHTPSVYLPPVVYIWIAGMVIMIVYLVFSWVKLRKMVAASVYKDECIYLCDDMDSPFILGLIKPKIYVPSGLDSFTMDCVIAHEKAHLERFDYLWKPLGFLLLSIYWFNPLLWLAYILLCRDIEAACDEKVLGTMDAGDYSQALLSCAAKQHFVSACPLAFGETNVKSRVKRALSYKKPAFWILNVGIVVILIACITLLTNKENTYSERVISLDGIYHISIAEPNKLVVSLYGQEGYPGYWTVNHKDRHLDLIQSMTYTTSPEVTELTFEDNYVGTDRAILEYRLEDDRVLFSYELEVEASKSFGKMHIDDVHLLEMKTEPGVLHAEILDYVNGYYILQPLDEGYWASFGEIRLPIPASSDERYMPGSILNITFDGGIKSIQEAGGKGYCILENVIKVEAEIIGCGIYAVTMEAKEVNEKRGTFLLLNHSPEIEYTYGAAYELRRWNGEAWATIETPEPVTWNALAYGLSPLIEQEIQVDWSYGYGVLSDGQYQFVKSFKDSEGIAFEISADFTVGICGLPKKNEINQI